MLPEPEGIAAVTAVGGNNGSGSRNIVSSDMGINGVLAPLAAASPKLR